MPPPNSYFSHKWLKMLPPPAVHSFKPRQHLAEELYSHQPLQSSTWFIKTFLLALKTLPLFIQSRRKGQKANQHNIMSSRLLDSGGFMEVLHGKDKRSPEKTIQLEIQEDTRKELWKHPRVSSLWDTDGSAYGTEALGRARTKTPPLGCGCADWSKLSTSRLFALSEQLCWLSPQQHEMQRQLIQPNVSEYQSNFLQEMSPGCKTDFTLWLLPEKKLAASYFKLQGHKTLSCCSEAEHLSWQIQWGCYGYISVKLWLLIARYWQFYGHSGAWEWTMLFLRSSD